MRDVASGLVRLAGRYSWLGVPHGSGRHRAARPLVVSSCAAQTWPDPLGSASAACR
jgi:hypothetical protein